MIDGIVSAAVTLLMAIAMIAIIYSVLSVGNKEVFGARLFIVQTGSMGKAIRQGDLVITKRVNTATLQKEDIITFISQEEEIKGKINTHRIFEVKNGKFITKGDANGQTDAVPVPPEHVIGKVVFHSSILGFLLRMLSKPLNMLVFIIIPVAYMAITDIKRARAKLKNAINEDEYNNDHMENKTE